VQEVADPLEMSVTMVRQKVKAAGLEVAEAACATGSSRLIANVPKACATRRRGWLTARCLIDVRDVRSRVDQSADVGAANGGVGDHESAVGASHQDLVPGIESRVACTIATSFDAQARPSAGVAVSFSSLCSAQPP
jgi:hypothetical protein